MRLIDVEPLDIITGKIPDGMDKDSYIAGQLEILEMIDKAPTVDLQKCIYELLAKIDPTIDAEPVRYAGWVPQPCGAKKPQWYECSNCSVVGSPHWKRCPICESKMLEHVEREMK